MKLVLISILAMFFLVPISSYAGGCGAGCAAEPDENNCCACDTNSANYCDQLRKQKTSKDPKDKCMLNYYSCQKAGHPSCLSEMNKCIAENSPSNVIQWSCTNPPTTEVHKCLNSGLAKLKHSECQISTVAQAPNCKMNDTTQSWNCEATTLNCQPTYKDHSCRESFKVISGEVGVSIARFISDPNLCRKIPGSSPTQQNSGAKPVSSAVK